MVYIVCPPQAKIFGSTLCMHIYIVIPESHGTVHHMHMCWKHYVYTGNMFCVRKATMCNYLYRVSADA